MSDIMESLSNHELIEEIKSLVAKEKLIDSEILMALKVVKHRKLHLRDGYASLADYCALVLGMSEDQAWKRSQAVDTITSHPWALEMLKSGDTKLSQLAMIKPKITKANEEIIKDFIPGKSKAEVKAFLETVGLNGDRLEPLDYVEIKIRVKKDTLAKIKRVRELQSRSRYLPAMEDVHEDVYAFWLAHHCPVEKAKRAKAKAEKKATAASPRKKAKETPTSCAGAGDVRNNDANTSAGSACAGRLGLIRDCAGAGTKKTKDIDVLRLKNIKIPTTPLSSHG